MRKLFLTSLLGVVLAFLAGCTTPTDLVYFQDIDSLKTIKMAPEQKIVFRPEDKLTIFVKTRDSEISQLFTLTSGNNALTNSTTGRAYTVDSKGEIDFPELGRIRVAGKTREEVAEYIEKELENRRLVNNSVVLVDYRNMGYNVLGEVKKPGRYEITKDHVTLVEAITEAGDLTINGLRTNVLVMRKEGDEMKSYRVNLLDSYSLYNSPVYRLQQDDLVYFQDIDSLKTIKLAEEQKIVFQPEDKLTIFVKTRDSEISQLFTLTSGNNSLTNSTTGRAYTVDSKGEIDFPELGRIRVAGKTREEVAEYIEKELENRRLVNNSVVLVDYRNMGYNVLGEVKRPGRYEITKDHVTLIEAITEAGDLTINGLRTNVLVMRKEGEEMKSYRVNLLDSYSLYNSPVYRLQQDDLIYVEPNPKRLRESTVNGNNMQTIGFWASALSFVLTVINLFK